MMHSALRWAVQRVKQVVPNPWKAYVLEQGLRIRGRIRRYPHLCPVCRVAVPRFVPLFEAQPQLHRELEAAGFDFDLLDTTETSNHRAYACPACGASDRDRLYALYLDHVLDREPPGRRFRVLDIAPQHALSNHIRRLGRCQYRTADLFMEGVDDRVDLQDMNVYANGSFDVVICSHVLEHVPDDRRAMRELRRVLAPGGFGILMAPINQSFAATREGGDHLPADERLRRFGQTDHLRWYSPGDFVARLTAAGFDVLALEPTAFGVDPERHGIARNSVLYVGRAT